MALLRALALGLALTALPAAGMAHHMGRVIPIAHSGGVEVEFAAQVAAAYFSEQMGRDTRLVDGGGCDGCIRALLKNEVPMAVVSCPWEFPPEGLVFMEPQFRAGDTVLIMSRRAAADLTFSLVDRYLEKLSTIPRELWQAALERVRRGEGSKKVALDLLRETDLL